MEKPRLTYFDMGGRADPIRMLLWHAKVDFEDERLSFEQWGERKASENLTHQLPYFTMKDGTKKLQGTAILIGLAHLHGYASHDAETCYD